MCAAKSDVRFASNSDRESRHPRKVMSALPLKADMCASSSSTREVTNIEHKLCNRGLHLNAEPIDSHMIDYRLQMMRLGG